MRSPTPSRKLKPAHGHHSPQSKGMVLLLSLALLAGLSLLAVLAANSMLQQRMMAANHADGELARLSAITAIAAGEDFLLQLPGDSRAVDCHSDCFAETLTAIIHPDGTLPSAPEFQADGWWLQWGQELDSTANLEHGLNKTAHNLNIPGRQAPRYLLEELEYQATSGATLAAEAPEISGVAYYRILGRGTGLAVNTTHVVESILARPWLKDSTGHDADGIDCSTLRPWYDCGRMAFRARRQ